MEWDSRNGCGQQQPDLAHQFNALNVNAAVFVPGGPAPAQQQFPFSQPPQMQQQYFQQQQPPFRPAANMMGMPMQAPQTHMPQEQQHSQQRFPTGHSNSTPANNHQQTMHQHPVTSAQNQRQSSGASYGQVAQSSSPSMGARSSNAAALPSDTLQIPKQPTSIPDNAMEIDVSPDRSARVSVEDPVTPKASVSVDEPLSASADHPAQELRERAPDPDEGESWDAGGDDATPADSKEDTAEESASGDDDESRAMQRRKKKPVVQKLAGLEKEHVNIVFIGHVDAGKSTISGQILALTGMVDKRTLEKYEKEAKEKNRETWYLSWALDTNQEERDKGKTVEVGRAYFETEKKHFTILDAPGHKSFVPNMISGAAQADIAILVISARRGEFETGFEKGGQTREHAMLVKTAGVSKLCVLINKMDDPTVKWSDTRYTECREKLLPYLKKVGYRPADVQFIPVSGQTGGMIKERPTPDVCPWFSGPAFLDFLDGLSTFKRDSSGATRIPIIDRYKDMGTIVLGKVESGEVIKGHSLTLMPNRASVDVLQIWSDDLEVERSASGENVKIKLRGVEEDDVSKGFVLCADDALCTTGKIFDAQVHILEYKSIICAGYSCVLHIHACVEEVVLKKLICTIDKKGEKVKGPRFIKQDMSAIVRFEVSGGNICVETFKDFPQMGRFTLRDEGKTIAVGKVLKVLKSE